MKNLKKIVAWICTLSFVLSMASSFSLAAGSENTITPFENSGLYVERTSSGNYLYGVPPSSTAKSVINLLHGMCVIDGSEDVKTGDVVTLYVNGNAVDSATVIIRGDLHVDGCVNAKDVIRLKAYLADSSVKIDNKLAADINGDGYITKTDLKALSNLVQSAPVKTEICSNATKTEYVAGEKFKSEGVFLKITYDDGHTYSYADGFTVSYPSGTCFKAGDTYVDLIHSGLSARVAVTVKPAGEGDIVVQEDNVIYYTTPALPANAGETVDLSLYDVQLSLDSTTDKSSITWSSSDLTVSNKTVKAPSKGVYKLTAKSGSKSKTIYLIVKEASESEYVLYYNDFSSSSMSDITVLKNNSSNISISGGKLVLDSSSTTSSSAVILFPEYIGDFGDYTYSAKGTITAAINDRRWASLMYRVQNSDMPYYQLCVRQNAATSDGVEMAYKTAGDQWAYFGKTAYTEKLNASSNYTFAVDAYGANATATVDGMKMIYTAQQTDFAVGRVGIQVNCCKAVYDEVKVTVSFREQQSLGKTTYSCPAIPANTGTTVRLSMYDVAFSKTLNVDRENVKWTSNDLTISANNTVKVTNKGVYKLTATYGKNTKTVYLIVKAPEETEYVLYYNDFSKNDMTDFQIIQNTDGSVKIADGKLVVAAPTSNSSFTRVLLPAYIGDFGDYSVEANATMTQSANESRWMAIMYRVCNNNYPYDQFCIRRNAATTANNGVELSYTTASATDWKYHGKASYTSALDAAKSYKFRINAVGTSATGYINGTSVISTMDLTQPIGRVGLQNCGSTTAYDDIKVTVDFSGTGFVSKTDTMIADVDPVSSNIILASTVVTEVKTANDLAKAIDSSSAVAILSINSSLQVVDSNGTKICTVIDALNALGDKTIPAFRIDSSAEATAIGNFINTRRLKDSFVVSTSVAQLSSVRSICTDVRGILDATKSKLDLATLRENCNKASSRICLLPAYRATQANSAYLSGLATTVWYMADSNTETELYNLITAGAQGIVTTEPERLKECLGNTDVFLKNSIVRPVNIIGHRGIPSKAPENTITGTLLAGQYGANIVENDVYLTSDGVVVVMHDGTIDRTTNGSGNIEALSYAQLQKYVVDYYPGYSEKIPTLEEYFQAIKDKDINLFIEVKSTQLAIVSKIKALIEKYDILDQCCIITFHMSIMDEFHKQMPGISNGFLTSMVDIPKVMEYTSRFNCTFNPGQASSFTPEFVAECAYRGITLWPWTLNDSATFDKYFLMGANGITTNYADFSQNYIRFLTTSNSEYTVETGRRVNVNVYKETYAGARTYAKDAEMIILSGDGNIYFDGSSVHAYEDGVTTVLFRQSFKLNNGTVAYVYSQPVTITAS